MTAATALLTPDAFLTGAWVGLIALLREQGFQPVALRFVQLDRATMSGVYQDAMSDRSRWSVEEVDRVWRVYESFYHLAPSALVYLRSADEDPTAALVRLKGNMRPEHASEGTLRAVGDAENVMMNLVHTADSREDLLRESTILLGEREATNYLNVCLGKAEPLVGDALRADLDMRYVPGLTARSSLSFPWILNALRFRATQLLVARYDADPRRALRVQAALRHERDDLDRSPTTLRRMKVAQRHNSVIAAELNQLSRGADDLRSALSALSAFAVLSGPRDYACVEEIRRSGLYVSDAEAVAVRLHGAAFKPGRALDEIYGA